VDVLSTLTPREEKVLKLRFGIEDGAPHVERWARSQRHPRAHPPNRGEGAAQAPPPSRSKKLRTF
jgi:RNA polymerase primary sigma factor